MTPLGNAAIRFDLCAVLGLLLLLVPSAHAQLGADPLVVGPVRMSGSVGLLLEANGTTADQARRDPFRSQLTAQASAAAWGFSYGLNALVTLQQVELEQRSSTPLSRLALSTQRGWFAGAVGDVSPTLSRYSLSGIITRGAYLELTPGDFLFTAVGGRSQKMSRPTDDNPLLEPTYEQYLWGGRVGWGRRDARSGASERCTCATAPDRSTWTRLPSPIQRRRSIRLPT